VIGRLDAGRQIYVDEASATTDMTRRRARAPIGERAICRVPFRRWSAMTIIGAMSVNGVVASMTHEGATNAETFVTFVEAVLAPQLRSGDVVFLDNLGAHKSAEARAAIEARGATLVLLPPYSPDFNPIEKLWSKVKTWLRARAVRTMLALGYAIGEALETITPSDCRSYFASCGVPVLLQ
jgi:transposase